MEIKDKPKVIIVMPAYNAEKTLEKTYQEIPREGIEEIILVDDASVDRTVEVARRLGIERIVHKEIKVMVGTRRHVTQRRLKKVRILWLWSTPIINMTPGQSRI